MPGVIHWSGHAELETVPAWRSQDGGRDAGRTTDTAWAKDRLERDLGFRVKRHRSLLLRLRLSNGAARSGVGGGICQLANLLHWMFERYLEGELRADRELPHSYRVFARDEQFLRHEGAHYRRNEIWRTVLDRRTGDPVGQELVKRNCARVKYLPTGVEIIDVSAVDR